MDEAGRVTNPSAGVTAPGYPPPPAGPQPVAVQPPARKNRGWVIALVVVAALLLFGCVGFAVWLSSSQGTPSPAFGDSIALIRMDGVIAGTGSVTSGVITPQSFIEQLDKAEADPRVKAVLIRVDSPGGTVAASQEIAMAVDRAQKPVVVSVGDICASGAYMVASQSDEIFAAPGSSVGSIGVIMEIPNVSGLLDKLGVEFTVLTQGDYKDAGSPYRSVTGTESAMFKEQMEIAYDQFISDVAEGRGLSEDEIRKLATGWVWLGTEAKDLGLVDTLGNYSDAVDRAADLGEIEGEPKIVSFQPTYSFQDLLSSLFGLVSQRPAPDAASLDRAGLPN
ncbi:MAG: signal peptide peptidase SppA [Coriobacteriales bacterium]|nr:signal peptide peptidase SppA [Actinomycetes bacterium]